MSERARKLLIVAGVVVVLGAPAIYFLGVHQPAQARGDARHEIAAWEARWARARGCIVAPPQVSSVLREAVAVQELAGAAAVPTTCRQAMGELTRGPGDASEIDAVEGAWQAIDTAAGTLARTYLTYRDRATKPGRDRLGEIAAALGAMDEAHAALRVAASMEPLPARAASALPAIGRATPLEIAGQPLVRLESARLSSGTLVLHAAGDRARAVAVLAPGKPPLVLALDRAVRSLPDLGWGAAGTARGLELGALDETGLLTAATTVPASSATVVLALGNATKGLVVATEPIAAADEGLGYARLRVRELRIEGGKVVGGKVREVQELKHDVDHAGRAVLAWVDRTGGVAATTLDVDGSPPDTLLAARRLGAGDRGCHTATTGWLHAGTQLLELRAGATPRELVEHALVGCGADAVLLRSRGATRFAVCTAAACQPADLAAAPPDAVPVLVGDRVFAVAAYDRVVGIWSEGAPPRFVALAQPFTPLHAVSDGTSIDLLGRAPAGLAIARIPAR